MSNFCLPIFLTLIVPHHWGIVYFLLTSDAGIADKCVLSLPRAWGWQCRIRSLGSAVWPWASHFSSLNYVSLSEKWASGLNDLFVPPPLSSCWRAGSIDMMGTQSQPSLWDLYLNVWSVSLGTTMWSIDLLCSEVIMVKEGLLIFWDTVNFSCFICLIPFFRLCLCLLLYPFHVLISKVRTSSWVWSSSLISPAFSLYLWLCLITTLTHSNQKDTEFF